MQDERPADETTEEPWFIPREYEIGGVRWFSDTVHELQRALHPLLAQVTRAELADSRLHRLTKVSRCHRGGLLPLPAVCHLPRLDSVRGGCRRV